ncbi:hypothetical protein [Aquimarina rubra]|uniref:WG repeat-containing protein n=1 Tax=Aquimarina rubra TaxID=1920033 RepID=A0ABW5LKU4_9FLAO
MIVVKFPSGNTIKSSVKVTFLSVFCVLLFNPVNSQHMDDFIEDDSFIIVEKPQKVYKGFYKNGKPYNGYFSKGNDEFPTVDYYENGEAKFQYSLDVYQMALGAETTEIEDLQEQEGEVMSEEDYEAYMKDVYKPKLNIKSVYQNGKIIDGYEYEELDSGIISRKIENKKVIAMHVDVFAIHYYQRNSVILRSDTIFIGSPTLAAVGDKLEVKMFNKSGNWVASYTINDKEIGSKYFITKGLENLPPNSTLYIYDQNEETYIYGTNGFKEYSSRLDIIDVAKIYFEKPEIFISQDIQNFFNDFIEASINEIKREKDTRLKEPEIWRGYVTTGDDGRIESGIRFIEKKENSFYIEYKEGSEVKNEEVNLINFQKVFKEHMNLKREN